MLVCSTIPEKNLAASLKPHIVVKHSPENYIKNWSFVTPQKPMLYIVKIETLSL